MQFLKDYSIFSRKERAAIIVIVSLILSFISATFFYPLFFKQEQFSHSEFENEIKKLNIEQSSMPVSDQYGSGDHIAVNDDDPDYIETGEKLNAEVFYFDPNTASREAWKKLGIKEKTINIIQNYISKGGKFYRPEDINKIYGLTTSDASRLMPYIRIKNLGSQNAFYKKKNYYENTAPDSKRKLNAVDVNLADTSALINLPGIGSKLSARIVKFRDKLGGFYSIEQVGETYNLPDSTFQKIKTMLTISNKSVRQININTASVDQLKIHPYISFNMAIAIVEFRKQHGNFKSIEEIRKIMLVPDDIFKKLSPYLAVK